MIWVLTLYLLGVPIYEEKDAHWETRADCMKRGWFLAQDYQKDHLKVVPDCTLEGA